MHRRPLRRAAFAAVVLRAATAAALLTTSAWAPAQQQPSPAPASAAAAATPAAPRAPAAATAPPARAAATPLAAAASRPAATPSTPPVPRQSTRPAAASAAGAVTAAAPTAWPTRPIKILVGFPGGSTPDSAARVLAESMARAFGQPVVVENRPGASGNVAADQVAKAGDDHTLGVVINGNLTSAKLLNPKLPFDPAKDFSLLSLIASAPLVLVTPANQPAGADFFVAARNAGSAWSYGSVGIGSVGHLGMEYVKSRAGNFDAVHVPYNGNPAVVTALLAGQVHAALIPPGIALPQVRAGKLKAIGLTGGRSLLAPEVAPLADLGIRMNDLEVWTALVGPAALSRAAQERLAREVPALVRADDARQKLFNAGWQVQGSSPEALKSRVRSETNILGGIILLRNIKSE